MGNPMLTVTIADRPNELNVVDEIIEDPESDNMGYLPVRYLECLFLGLMTLRSAAVGCQTDEPSPIQ
jgi:hypothetical protein